MAHSALVPRPNDASGNLVFAKRAIAENARVHFYRKKGLREGAVDRSKSMAGMSERCSRNAIRAVIPVRTAQALVTYTRDLL